MKGDTAHLPDWAWLDSADLFVCLWDRIQPWSGELADAKGEGTLTIPKHLPAEILDADGGVPPGLAELVRHPDALLGAFAAMRAIDIAFADLGAARTPRLHQRLHHTGTLTLQAERSLLPALHPPGVLPPDPPLLFGDNFVHLRRGRVTEGCDVAWRPVAPLRAMARTGGAASLEIAFLPLIGRDDVRFSLRDAKDSPGREAPRPTFDVHHNDGAEERLFSRLVDAVWAAEDAGAGLLLAPELAFTPALWHRLSRWLVDNLRASTRSLPGLHWILAGTAAVDADEGGRPRNRAVLLSRGGDVLIEQDKMHAFCMTKRQQEFYHLDEVLGGEHAWESIREGGRRLHLFDSPALGRVGILICEDLTRDDLPLHVALDLGLQTILTPVMDGSLLPERWVSKTAAARANSHGLRVVAVNSVVLPELGGTKPPHAIGLVRLAPPPAPADVVHATAAHDVLFLSLRL